MPSRRFYLFALAVLLAAALTAQPAAVLPKPPNFILLLADDLGYGDLGVTGSKQIPTPHIDSLAANGVRFSNACAGDLLSHELDFVQYLLGHGIPDNCVCSGLNALLHDDREVPDTWVATYEFAKLGRTVTFEGSMNTADSQPVTICGRDATLRFDGIAHDVSTFEIIPAGHNQKADLPKGYERGKTPYQPNHVVDWVNCIRGGGTPKCSTDEAFIETATFLMSLKAQQEQRMVRWDAAREEIV